MNLVKTIVMKFGGTSVEDAEAFARVARIVAAQAEQRPVVVVSAMSGFTSALVASAQTAARGDSDAALRSLDEHFTRHMLVAASLGAAERAQVEALLESARGELADLLAAVAASRMARPRMQDAICSYGERLSAPLLAAVIRTYGLPARAVDARRCIVTDDEHGCAAPLLEETEQAARAELMPLVNGAEIPVLGGFIAATKDGTTTTLGRGGSDYTASLVGAALGSSEIQIWTDVMGMMTADPRLVPTAQTVARLSYAEAAELAYFGARVLHPKTIQPAVEQRIPVRVLNSRAPDEPGTLICAEINTTPLTVKAIAYKEGITTVEVTSARMLGSYGFLHAIFEIFKKYRTAVDVVATSEVSVSLSLDETSALSSIVAELERISSVSVKGQRAIICVVGEGLRRTPGVAAYVFNAVRDINITLISQGASSINLTFVIDEEHVAEAVAKLHRAFFERAVGAEDKIHADDEMIAATS